MNYWYIIPIVIIVLMAYFLGNGLVSGYEKVIVTIPESDCDTLLKMIQKDGIKPNYQYDVREWIAKECWK